MKEISAIINDDWVEINGEIPEGKLLIRIKDPNNTYSMDENTNEICYIEDLRMAEYKDGNWELVGPHQKYEYSPVINKDHTIKENMKVTHYKVPTEEEIVIWSKRFNMHNHYEHLSLHIDEENEEMVYDSLTISLAALSKIVRYAEDEETRTKFAKAYTVISDLQSLIDTGKEVTNAVD